MQSIILADIDGTISNCEHRLHYISDEINVGDYVRPVGIPNAKEYKGIVDFIGLKNSHGVITYGVLWDEPYPFDRYSTVVHHTNIRKHKSYSKFFAATTQDTPIVNNIEIIKILSQAYPIVFISGRPDSIRQETGQWLIDNGLGYASGLKLPVVQMRKDGDYRKDCIIKQEIYEQHIKDYYDVILVIDDRKQCVDMWRSLGLNCWQVNEGNF